MDIDEKIESVISNNETNSITDALGNSISYRTSSLSELLEAKKVIDGMAAAKTRRKAFEKIKFSSKR